MAKYGQFKYGTQKYGEAGFITDRTQRDIEERTKKAYINAEDLNRINGYILYLKNELWEMGYKTEVTAKNDWTKRDFPTTSLMRICIEDINRLLDCYTVYPTTPAMPLTFDFINFRQLNDLEQNVKDMYYLVINTKQGYRYLGDCICGG